MNRSVTAVCPACSQVMHLQASTTGLVAVNCPCCAHLFQVDFGIPGSYAYYDPLALYPPLIPYHRPVLNLPQPVQRARRPLPKVVTIGLPVAIATAFMTALFGYLTFHVIGLGTVPGAALASVEVDPEQASETEEASKSADAGFPSGFDVSSFSVAAGSSIPATDVTPTLEAPQPVEYDTPLPTAAPELADVIERCEKSVVRIEVTGHEGDSLGSGFVVDSEGTIVTNCHVLVGATRATAYFPDGRSVLIQGTLLVDEPRDIIVARLSSADAPPLSVASTLPRKGEHITALGCPHGLSFTATNGIVSAIRDSAEMGPAMRGTWIQVDAPLSPGNSGGPLIDARGNVVAMSTLASQGSAQNLNFGISGNDIKMAVESAKQNQLTSLSSGVAKMKSEDSSSGNGDSFGQSLIVRKDIPKEAIDRYVADGRKGLPSLVNNLRTASARLTAELREMRKGSTNMPPEVRRLGVSIARQKIMGQKYHRWYFESEELKHAVIEEQLEKIRSSTRLKNELKDSSDPEALFQVLWNLGPGVDTKRIGSVGFASDMVVVNAFNEHEVVVVFDESPYLLWAPSTAGLYPGTMIDAPAFVSGTTTAELRSGITTSLTVLQLLSEDELRSAIQNNSLPEPTLQNNSRPEPTLRTWTDRSGKFSVEAELLGQDETKVSLRKKGGTLITVAKDNLSEADVQFLADQPF